MAFQVSDRERRWLYALLILATVAVGFLVAQMIAQTFFFFGDVVLVFFLAWLLAFILSPIVSALVRHIAGLPAGMARWSSYTSRWWAA